MLPRDFYDDWHIFVSTDTFLCRLTYFCFDWHIFVSIDIFLCQSIYFYLLYTRIQYTQGTSTGRWPRYEIFERKIVPDRIGRIDFVPVDFNTIIDVETVCSIPKSPLAPSNLLVDAEEPSASPWSSFSASSKSWVKNLKYDPGRRRRAAAEESCRAVPCSVRGRPVQCEIRNDSGHFFALFDGIGWSQRRQCKKEPVLCGGEDEASQE